MKNKLLVLTLGLLLPHGASADAAKNRAIQICKTEIMFSANPPTMEDCIREKLESPDYKSLLNRETFESLKYDGKDFH